MLLSAVLFVKGVYYNLYKSMVRTGPVAIPALIKQARLEAGLTLEKAAESLGTDYNTIWRYEAGRHKPSGPTLYALATLYDRPVEWFFQEADAGENTKQKPRAPVTILEPPAISPSDDKEFVEGIVTEMQAYLAKRGETQAAAHEADDDMLSIRRIATLNEVAPAAGSGAAVFNERVTGWVPFRRDWLAEHSIDAALSNIVPVQGDSMEPTLPEGCSILVDRSRREPQEGRIYVMQTEDGLVVKRLGRDELGRWEARSDSSKWETVPMLYDTDIIGEVRWSGRTY